MNFEDSIFILNVRIRMIQDTLILDADPGLFFDKTMDDLDFIESSLVFLLEKLTTNEKLLERDEQFFNLSEAERIFCEILFELSRGKTSLSSVIDQDMALKISDMRNRSLERRKLIEASAAQFKTSNSEPLVGYDELHELLNG